MATYTEIPFVPEGALDPAAGLNQALYVIRSITHANVISIGDGAPPGSPADGDMYIVGSGSGAWTSQNDNLARYVATGAFWDFFVAGALVRQVVNLDDGQLYYFNESNGWVAAS